MSAPKTRPPKVKPATIATLSPAQRVALQPEIDRAAFFTVPAARERMKFTQQPLIDRLAELLARMPVSA